MLLSACTPLLPGTTPFTGPDAGGPTDAGCVRAADERTGTLDETFQNGRREVSTTVATSFFTRGAVMDAEGRIYVFGGAVGCVSEGQFDLGVMRFLSDGTPDLDYGATASGITCLQFGGANLGPHAAVLDDRGRLVVAGGVDDGASGEPFVIRLLADGRLDETLNPTAARTGLAGTMLVPRPPGSSAAYEYAYDVAIEGMRILVTGGSAHTFADPQSGFVTALEDDGAAAAGFTTIADDGVHGFFAPHVDADGFFVVTTLRASQQFAVYAFDRNGAARLGFGDLGVARGSIGASASARARTLAVAPDGALYVGGEDGSRTANVVRFTSDGTLSSDFAAGRFASTDLRWDLAYGAPITTLCDGRLLLGGFASRDGVLSSALQHIASTGAPDETFGPLGVRVFAVPATVSTAVQALLLDAEGRAVLVSGTDDNRGPVLLRVLP